jgi:3-methyladenine DNA glycosylase Tag
MAAKERKPKPERTAPPVKTPKRPTPAEDVPRRVTAPSLDDHLEIMTRAIFQAGLSWAIIADRWPAFRGAFDAFAVDRVAAYGEADVERLMETEGVLHSRSKIEGTIKNAQTLRTLAQAFGSIDAYVARFPDYDALFRDTRERFAYLGDLSCYYWLFRTGLPVPRFEEWMKRQAKDHPRMREMVLAGREAGTSTEHD